jgi:hypothetical protein
MMLSSVHLFYEQSLTQTKPAEVAWQATNFPLTTLTLAQTNLDIFLRTMYYTIYRAEMLQTRLPQESSLSIDVNETAHSGREPC